MSYKRIQQYFEGQLQVPLSEGSIYNFNAAAYVQLAVFDEHNKEKLTQAALAHADETSINILTANAIGCIASLMRRGHIIIRTLSGERWRWTKWVYYPDFKASCATTTGSLITVMILTMLCATLITSES